MSILLEQIEHLMDFLRSDSPAITEIDFFEQGYEMTLRFSRTDGEIDVLLKFKGNDRTIHGRFSSEELSSAICRFLLDFLHAVGTLIPGMLADPAFLQWFTYLCIDGRKQ